MRHAIYAVGDVHGRLDLLDELLKKIEEDAGTRSYQLVFLGDYVDRGPQSKQVIDRLIEVQKRDWKYPPVFLKGNHEFAVENIVTKRFHAADFEAWKMKWGGVATLKSYGLSVSLEAEDNLSLCREFKKAVGVEHRRFLRNLQYTFQTASHFFCHAGIDFDRPLNDQREHDLIWTRKPFLQSEKRAKKIIVHGHSITDDYKPQVKPNRIAVDTGAFASGSLTACVLKGREKPRFISTPLSYLLK